jgi:shikimate dehydrogenase
VKDVYTFADLQNWSAAGANEEPPIRVGIFGQPVAHSLSPQVQNAALKACGIPMQYARFDIAPEELEPALRLLPSLGFVGVNLTAPHKIAGARAADQLDEFAQRVGAANTIRVEGDKLVGFNTDGAGFSQAIRSEFSVDLRDLRVLLLGAGGGAGRTLAMQCASEGCERLVISNRTAEKALELVTALKPSFSDVRVAGPVARLEAVPWDERAWRTQFANTDLLVNATTIGMHRTDPPLLRSSALEPHLMVFDVIYASARTPLLAAAAEAGARGANGLTMLLHQAALAFEIWFDREAPLEAMRNALREHEQRRP